MEQEKSYQKVKKLQSQYANPIVQSLIALSGTIPGAGPFIAIGNEAVKGTIAKMYEGRRKAFFDELASGRVSLTEGMLKDEDFLHCYFATLRAVHHTRRKEKIKLFARFLGVSGENLSRPADGSEANRLLMLDEFDRMLKILDDLDYIEIQMLAIIDGSFVEEIKDPGAPFGISPINYDWGQVTNNMVKKLDIQTNEIPSALYRLQRTGLFRAGAGLSEMRLQDGVRIVGNNGQLLPLYKRFKEWVLKDIEVI